MDNKELLEALDLAIKAVHVNLGGFRIVNEYHKCPEAIRYNEIVLQNLYNVRKNHVS